MLLVKMGIIDPSVLSNLAVSFMHLAFHLRQIGIACTVKYPYIRGYFVASFPYFN